MWTPWYNLCLLSSGRPPDCTWKARLAVSWGSCMALSFLSLLLLLFSRSVVSDSLQPHGLQHARLPFSYPSATLPALSAARCLKLLFPFVIKKKKTWIRKEGKSGSYYRTMARSASFTRIYESFQRYSVHKQAYIPSPLFAAVLQLTSISYYPADCSLQIDLSL